MSGHAFQKTTGLRFSTGYRFLAATWMPEGLVLTPRTTAAPYGYGFPKRDRLTGAKINPPFGTLIAASNKEALNQVLINRFENNKYLDRLGFVSGIPKINDQPIFELPEINDRLRDSLSIKLTEKPFKIVYWPVLYEPRKMGDVFWDLSDNKVNWTDVPGINRWSGGYQFNTLPKPEVDEYAQLVGDLPSRQWDDDKTPLIFETESEFLYCHWPEELLYDNDAAEAIFQETNRYRMNVAAEPIHRELRGYANTGRMILSEMQRAEVMFHDDVGRYRPGYGKVVERAANSGHTAWTAGENLLAGVSGFSWESGVEVALGWRNSPLHYANMTSTTWETRHTSLTVFGNVKVTLKEKGAVAGSQSSLDQVFDPPFSGKAWAEFFIEHNRWLYAGMCEFRTIYGTITTDSFSSPMGKPYKTTQAGGPFIFLNGQAFFVEPIYQQEQVSSTVNILGASLYKDGGTLCFLVIYSFFNLLDSKWYVNHLTRSVAVHGLWSMGTPFLLEEFGGFVQCFQFYEKGTRGFITTQYLNASITYNTFYTDLPSDALQMFPSSLRILEFDLNTGFSFGAEIRPSDITYTVASSSFTGPSFHSNRINVRHLGASIAEGDSLHPFINNQWKLSYLKRKWSVDYDHRWTSNDDIVFNFAISDRLVFPSGKEITLRNFSYSYTGEYNGYNRAVFSNDPSISFLFYLNPVNEECLVGKVLLEDNNPYISGTLNIQHEGQTIKTYPRIDFHLNSSIEATAPYKKTGTFGDYGYHTINISDIGYNHLPYLSNSVYYNTVPFKVTQSTYYFCGSTAIRKYPDKLIVGTYPASITAVSGVYKFCYANDNKTAMEHGYDFGLPVTHAFLDRAAGFLVRYKDKFVSQTEVISLFGNTNGLGDLNPAGDDRFTVYSNIPDLNKLVGMGQLSQIGPIGVIP